MWRANRYCWIILHFEFISLGIFEAHVNDKWYLIIIFVFATVKKVTIKNINTFSQWQKKKNNFQQINRNVSSEIYCNLHNDLSHLQIKTLFTLTNPWIYFPILLSTRITYSTKTIFMYCYIVMTPKIYIRNICKYNMYVIQL